MKQRFLKRLVIFFAVLLACFLLLLFLSDGKMSTPDASQYRDLLYKFTFFVLPLIVMFDFFYLFAALVNNPLKTTVISLVAGMIGPLWLIYIISTDKDPMAMMAMIAVVDIYAIASVFIFVLLVLIERIKNRLKK